MHPGPACAQALPENDHLPVEYYQREDQLAGGCHCIVAQLTCEAELCSKGSRHAGNATARQTRMMIIMMIKMHLQAFSPLQGR